MIPDPHTAAEEAVAKECGWKIVKGEDPAEAITMVFPGGDSIYVNDQFWWAWLAAVRREEVIQEKNRKIAELEAYADKLAAGLPEGMLPKDIELLQESNAEMATLIQGVRQAREEARGEANKLPMKSEMNWSQYVDGKFDGMQFVLSLLDQALQEKAMKSLTQASLLSMAINGEKPTKKQIIATYAKKKNWRKVYVDGRCYWAWVGPTIVGYELARYKTQEDTNGK